MAVFSKDQITGKVIINARAEESKTIINYTNSDSDTIQSCGANNFKIDGYTTKINKYSIKTDGFYISPKNMETLFKSDKDFTWCFWGYPVRYSGNNFYMVIVNKKDDGYATHFIENNNGRSFSNTGNMVVLERFVSWYNDIESYIGAATFDSWRHYAITKKGNTIYFFKNGKIVYSASISDNIKSIYFDSDGDTHFSISYNTYAGYFYLDDFIFISGQCLWTSDYAIPKEPILGYDGKYQEIYPRNYNKNNKIFSNY